MRIFQLNRSDNNVSICRVLDDAAQISDIIAQWESVHPGVTIVSNQQITEQDIPANRAHRDAWRAQ